MTILPGEFWIAEISFTGGAGSKKRPVLVLWLDGQDVVVAAVTSAKPRSAMDVELGEWVASGFDGSAVAVGLFGTIVVVGTGWTNWLF